MITGTLRDERDEDKDYVARAPLNGTASADAMSKV
jgi:hypothetical protein